MLRSVNEMQGYHLLAKDGTIGKAHTLYFDDQSWTVRYLVADTGNWLQDRKVLISPVSFEQPDWSAKLLPVHLTTEQIENSPKIDAALPVSRQHEHRLSEYYQWPMYWAHSGVVGINSGAMPPPRVAETKEQVEAEVELEERSDPNLRSTREVTGYSIAAIDGDIGHVEDFIVDVQNWILRYIIVDTRNWLPGKKVLLSTMWIDQIKWPDAKVSVDLTKEAIQNAPEFDPSLPINRKYEERLYDFYGRPKYWK